MSGSIKTRARTAALAMAVGAFGLLATASPSLAATKQPKQGANCQTDGKIEGVGSTLAGSLQTALINGFASDVCGSVGAATNLNTDQGGHTVWSADPTVSGSGASAQGNMVVYNWTTQDGKKSNNGSGEGLEAMQCRIAEFGGSDIPYTTAMLNTLDGATGSQSPGPSYAWPYADPYQTNQQPPSFTWNPAPPAETGGPNPATCSVNTYNSGTNTVTPPFPPAPIAASSAEAADPYHTGYPNTADTAANMMSFPIGAGAAAIVLNLQGCTSVPTAPNLTGPQLSDIYSGVYDTWASDPATSGWGCPSNLKITRAVRQDSSGTTYAVMTYLKHVASGTLCDGSSWSTLAYQSSLGSVNDSTWPDNSGTNTSCGITTPVKYVVGTGNTGSTHSSSSADPMVPTVGTTPGSIGYGELANFAGAQAPTFKGSTVTSGSPTVTLASAFADDYNGEAISGPGIPSGTTILSGAETTTLTLSANATASSGTGGVTLTVTDPNLSFAFLQQATNSSGGTGTAYVPPGTSVTGPVSSSVGAANCADATSSLTSAALPNSGTDFTGAVGLDSGGWAVDNPPNSGQVNPPGDITYTSDQWPICTFTYDFAWTGLPAGSPGNAGSASVGSGPLQGITFDQERTLYSYFTYVLSPAAQASEQAAGYQPVPNGWLTTLRTGFQTNF